MTQSKDTKEVDELKKLKGQLTDLDIKRKRLSDKIRKMEIENKLKQFDNLEQTLLDTGLTFDELINKLKKEIK